MTKKTNSLPLQLQLLLGLAFGLALIVVVLGATVRLHDAGLACPDWPGCFDRILGIPDQQQVDQYQELTGDDTEFEPAKAWLEVIHRYVASILGLLILLACALAYVQQHRRRHMFLVLSLLVIVQGLFGKWTVTLDLTPAIVIAHLLGGWLIVSVIAYLLFTEYIPKRHDSKVSRLRPLVYLALLVLFAQVALGGWTSANYAGLSCPKFPSCTQDYLPQQFDFSGFALVRSLHKDAQGNPLTLPALMSIHFIHRHFAYLLAALLFYLAYRLWRIDDRGLSVMLSTAVILQILVGIATVQSGLKVSLALMHHIGALLIVLIMMAVLSRLR